MALGIDGAAHRGALESGGATAALLGGGVDVVYPPMHRALHRAIVTQGVVLSEALPGVPPLPGAFPKRNRLIAALSKAVIVVEAGERSGALLTSRDALELGRVVAAVPGLIDAPQCVGTNQLLRDGAIIIASPEDALVLAGLAAPGSRAARPRGTARDASFSVDLLSSHESAVLEAVSAGAANIAGLARHTGLPLRDITAALTALELAGAVQSDHAGEVRIVV
jgi:DNA processing protein